MKKILFAALLATLATPVLAADPFPSGGPERFAWAMKHASLYCNGTVVGPATFAELPLWKQMGLSLLTTTKEQVIDGIKANCVQASFPSQRVSGKPR